MLVGSVHAWLPYVNSNGGGMGFTFYPISMSFKSGGSICCAFC